MAVFAKDITPLTKGGSVKKYAGKGSQSAPMPDRGQLKSLSRPANQSPQNYAKATPMSAAPVPGPGTGGWSGNGM